MVTDEERDYMYRVYAQDRHMRINLGIRRRLAPLLENDRRTIELMNALLFSLPGTPVIYYGDEIGMGDNIYLGDRNGVRTPMQWSADRNAGFSRANPQKLYLPVNIDPEYHYEAVNVEAQQNNPHSLLWWMKRLIAQRKQLRALGRGTLEFLYPENRRILAFVRSYEEERVLVVANLSRFAQCTELDLAKYQGLVPLELFGKTEFPAIADRPVLPLARARTRSTGSRSQSKEARQETMRIRTGEPPTIAVPSWDEVFSDSARAALNRMLPYFLRERRWFRGENRTIRLAEIQEVVRVPQVAIVPADRSAWSTPMASRSSTRLPLSVATSARATISQWVLARLRPPTAPPACSTARFAIASSATNCWAAFCAAAASPASAASWWPPTRAPSARFGATTVRRSSPPCPRWSRTTPPSSTATASRSSSCARWSRARIPNRRSAPC